MRESRAQTLRLNYEEIKFRPGVSIDDFAMRLQALVNKLEVLGDPLDEKKDDSKRSKAVQAAMLVD